MRWDITSKWVIQIHYANHNAWYGWKNWLLFWYSFPGYKALNILGIELIIIHPHR